MGWQTTDALIERKLRPWLRRGVISRAQYNDLVAYCVEHGFWQALGKATKTKYRNLKEAMDDSSNAPEGRKQGARGEKRFAYQTVFIPKRLLSLQDYVTLGGWSARRQKRHRKWINGYFFADGLEVRPYLEQKYPGWKVYRCVQTQGVYTLRKELDQS